MVFVFSVVITTLVEEDTGLVVIVAVDVVLALATTTAVLPSVVFSEVRLAEEDVVWVSVTKLDVIVVDALVALLTTLVSSVAVEVVLSLEVVFDVVWADVESFVVLEEDVGKSVGFWFVLTTVGKDWFVVSPSVTFADAVYVEGNADELDAVVAAAVDVSVVAAVAVDVPVVVVAVDVPVVLPTNIIQPSCHNKQKQRKSHKNSTLTYAKYINNVNNNHQNWDYTF